MNRAVLLLRGQVRVRVETPFPERVLNLCTAHGVPFFEPKIEDAAVTLTLSRGAWRTLRPLLRESGAQWHVQRRRGVPFFLAGFRRRYALAAGLALCAALLGLNALFIWDVQVTGNETVPTERILRALERNGVRWGTFVFSVRPQSVCNHVLLEVPELAWLTVNVRGCRANVQVVERVKKPEVDARSEPANLVAAKTALVTRVLTYDGRACVLPGQTVLAGELLISGAVDTEGTANPSVASRLLPGMGEVWGRTWYELSVRIPLTQTQKQYAPAQRHRIFLRLGKNRVKIFGKGSSQNGMECDKITKTHPLTLPGGAALPAVLTVETLRPYEAVSVPRSRAAAQAQGEAYLSAYLRTLLTARGSVTSERFACAVQGECLLVTLSAECLEQIGVRVPILVE